MHVQGHPEYGFRADAKQGPVWQPSARQLEAFRDAEPDDQTLYLGRILARSVATFPEGAAYRSRRLLARCLPAQDDAQRARGLTISQRAYVLDVMPAPGLLVRLVVRRRSIDVLLVAADPRRVAAFGIAPLRLVPDAGDSTRLAALGADWWGRSGEGALDWLTRTNSINVALPTGEVLTIRADERGIGLAVCMEEAPAQAASGASWEEHSWSVATKRSNSNNARLRC